MQHNALLPVIMSMREARATAMGINRIPNDADAEVLNGIRSEAVDIVKTYVAACMKNAIFTISTAHPDTDFLEFGVEHLSPVGDDIKVVITAVSEDGRQFRHQNITVVEDMINNFVSKCFSKDEVVEFFDGYRVLYSGVVKPPSNYNKASSPSI